MSIYRSLLFAPGNHARRVEKALTLDADALILDLEDAVAVAEKVAARASVAAALTRPRHGLAYARVNAFDTPFCHGDLQAVLRPGLNGILLPKVETPQQVFAVDWLMTQLESERGIAPGSIDLMLIVETGRGLAAAQAIADCGVARMRRLCFGAGDYTLDMRMTWSREEWEVDHARATLAVASRAAGLDAPLDTVWVHLGDIDGLNASARRARALGYQGKMCIHPEQIAAVNAVYSPTGEEVARARRYVSAFEAAEASGSASIQVDGFFIDYPIVEQARRTVARAEAIAGRGR